MRLAARPWLSVGRLRSGEAAPPRRQDGASRRPTCIPEGYPTVTAVEEHGQGAGSKATNGRLSVQMYASMQLGGEKEAIEQAQIGAIALARVSVGALGPVVHDLNVLNLPFLFRDTAHMRRR